MKSNYNDSAYIKDSISINESNFYFYHWEVWIRKSARVKPPNFLIIIHKITGKPEDISNKLE
jgi:hypothetical protein